MRTTAAAQFCLININDVFRAMRDGNTITITLSNRQVITGQPVGIRMEDGSRKCWLIQIAGRSGEYFVRSK